MTSLCNYNAPKDLNTITG